MTAIPSPLPISPGGLLQHKAQALASELRTEETSDRARVAQQFEGILVSLLLKEMRQTLGKEGLFGSDTSDIYGGLFDQFMGQHLAQSGGLGISKLVGAYIDASKTND